VGEAVLVPEAGLTPVGTDAERSVEGKVQRSDVNVDHISTYWHEAYVEAARAAYPGACGDHDLAVGWKLTNKDGTTHDGYFWPLVNGDHDLPVLHVAGDWCDDNGGSCPSMPGDGLCLVTTSIAEASSGGISLVSGVGHVLVFAPALARSDTTGKFRVPFCIDVDAFDPVMMVHLGLSTANLSGAHLPRALLSGAKLSGALLSRANLSWALLSGANLSRADLSRADLSGANLLGANLSGANLPRANLLGANLLGANLSGALLSRANLSRANLSWANVSGANLLGANLSGANLSGANLSWANLSGANLSGVRSSRTRWPEGFMVPEVGDE
jgi:hypothetical protein